MPSRRSLIKAAGLVSVAAAAVPAKAATAELKPYTGPHEMPRGLTLLSIRQKDDAETLGVKMPGGILDVAAANEILGADAPVTLESLLTLGNASALTGLIQAAASSPKTKGVMLDENAITFGRMFINPSKIICVGLNYKAHVEETGEKLPKEPILFNKYNNTLAAHRDTVPVPPKDVSTKLDYETELLVVIGKRVRNVSVEAALDCVAGYCVGHDFSARDLQLEKGGQWMIGKTLDKFAPIGPYFVSADLVGDPNALDIGTKVNGEVRQASNTKNFIFNVQTVIAYASKLFALEPGDIIFTGTPPGVIIGKPKDQQVWLKAGDKIESTIEKLGTLTFTLA